MALLSGVLSELPCLLAELLDRELALFVLAVQPCDFFLHIEVLHELDHIMSSRFLHFALKFLETFFVVF